MATFSGFFDNVFGGITNPKGNLGDWQHAARTFVDDSFKFSPKTKFLYHVTFFLTAEAQSTNPQLQTFNNQIGILVKNTDLPQYSAELETKNQYNRKKNIQTSISYNPITMELHDDNFGITTLLLETYFKYYFADGKNTLSSGAYGTLAAGDNLYAGADRNRFRHGLDNDTPVNPFFDRIEIAQMSRKTYTKYTLINPLISDWSHDSVDYSASTEPMKNSLTINYETVLYERGNVEAGDNGDPTGFGRVDSYDTTPSPLSILGGSSGGLLDAVGGVGDIVNGEFSPLQSVIAGANVFDTARNLSSEGLREEGFNVLRDALGNVSNGDVSGIPEIFIPKNSGAGSVESAVSAGESLPGDVTASRASIEDSIQSEQQSLQRSQRELGQATRRGDTAEIQQLETRIANNQKWIGNYEQRLNNL
jgi:hypothetical protein